MIQTTTSRWTFRGVERNPDKAIIFKLATNKMGTRPIQRHIPVPNKTLFASLQSVPANSSVVATLAIDDENDTSELTNFEVA